MSFTVGKTYQIVLNTDLDGNTLPFPHTMVGTCLSFDKEYATFLDPMTNIVRGMKVKQGDPKEKESKTGSKTPAPTAPSAPTAPTAPAKPSVLSSMTSSMFKKTPTAPKVEPKDVPRYESDPNRHERRAEPDLPAEMNKRILQKFKDHLASKKETFPPDLTADLEAIQKKTVPGNYVYSFTGGLAENPTKLGTGPNTIGSIKSKYEKVNETCFFLFDTKRIIEKGSGFLFMVALTQSECDRYDKKINFE
jgi:hypothetical protein